MCHQQNYVEKAYTSIEKFCETHLELLEQEKDAEIQENALLQQNCSVKGLQKKGICIPKVRISHASTGLFGRSLLHFESFWAKGPLPSHSISSGDIVGIGNVNSEGKVGIITSGIIIKVTDLTISVAFEKNSNFSDLENDTQYAIIKLANDVTYKRLKRALKVLETKGRDSHLADVLFGEKEPAVIDSSSLNDVVFTNNNLNDAQKEAVRFSLTQKDVAIIHGPPGTGKTTTVVECILQAISCKMKVLACAPSNIAVDNLVEKLSTRKVKLVRLGHPARFLTNIQKFSLDAIVSNYDGSNVVEELRREIDELREKISKTKGANVRRNMWQENRSLLKEVKQREKIIVQHVLTNADIILCTLTSGSDDGPLKYIAKDHFDICFIDECSQAIEAACWIPLLMVRKCILAGDHNQLPPTIKSEKAAKEGLALTLMERLLSLYGDKIKKMLTTQYRMNEVIMRWPSDQLYESKLQAHESVQRHLLIDLDNVERNEETEIPLLLIDTAGSGLQELQVEDDDSKANEGEADIVASHVEKLVNSGLNQWDVAVITPYNLQVEAIKSRLSGKYPKVEIRSVDGFQGREKEAVVLSLVRSNDSGEVGFLSEDRRINVAITRAKRHLAIICDSETVSHHPFLKSFVEYCMEKGETRMAFEYNEVLQSQTGMNRSSELGKIKAKKAKPKKKLEKKKSSFSADDKSHGGLPPETDREEEKRITEENFNEQIQSFVESNESSYVFPISLSPFERRVVHEICESLGLLHVSSGEGSERCIEIKKKISPTDKEDNPEPENLPIETDNAFQDILNHRLESSAIIKDGETTKEQVSIQKQSSVNANKKKPTQQNSIQNVSKKNAKHATKPKLKVLNLKETGNEDEDFDSLIEQVVKADKTCSYENCKKCIAALFQVCTFCKRRFCFTHFMPEIHGCGDEAKSAARAQIRKEKVLYPGSGKPQKKDDPIKHNYLQKKLDKKLSELSSKRKPKKKEDEK